MIHQPSNLDFPPLGTIPAKQLLSSPSAANSHSPTLHNEDSRSVLPPPSLSPPSSASSHNRRSRKRDRGATTGDNSGPGNGGRAGEPTTQRERGRRNQDGGGGQGGRARQSRGQGHNHDQQHERTTIATAASLSPFASSSTNGANTTGVGGVNFNPPIILERRQLLLRPGSPKVPDSAGTAFPNSAVTTPGAPTETSNIDRSSASELGGIGAKVGAAEISSSGRAGTPEANSAVKGIDRPATPTRHSSQDNGRFRGIHARTGSHGRSDSEQIKINLRVDEATCKNQHPNPQNTPANPPLHASQTRSSVDIVPALHTVKGSILTSVFHTSPPPQPGPVLHKFVDSSLRPIPQSPILQHLSPRPGCCVVGVLGRTGAGKRTLINSLLPDTIPSVTTANGDAWKRDLPNFENANPITTPFTTTNESAKTVSTIHSVHPTSGIDLYIHPTTRTIYLNTRSITTDQTDTRSTNLTSFLLSVCHVLILVSDDPVDPDLWDFIKFVSESETSNNLNQNNNETERPPSAFPTIYHVTTDTPPEATTPFAWHNASRSFLDCFEGSKLAAYVRTSLERVPWPYWVGGKWGGDGERCVDGVEDEGVYFVGGESGYETVSVKREGNGGGGGGAGNVILLPSRVGTESGKITTPYRYSVMLREFRKMVLEAGISAQAKNPLLLNVSEKEWYRNAVQVLESISQQGGGER
ncbi:hypothetical protein HK097_003080, partial [Rhizophlyctis rosea]